MDIIVYIVSMAFIMFFTLIGFKYVEFAVIGIIANMFVIGLLLNGGLDVTVGYVGEELITNSFEIDFAIIFNVLFAVVSAFRVFDYVRD